MSEENRLFFARPSLRRAWFYAFLYLGTMIWGYQAVDQNPQYERIFDGLFVLLIVLMTYSILNRFCTSYTISNERVQSLTGIVARKHATIPIGRIMNLNLNQNALERILGLVTVNIDSAGGEGYEVTFRRITRGNGIKAEKVIEGLLNQTESEHRDAMSQAK